MSEINIYLKEDFINYPLESAGCTHLYLNVLNDKGENVPSYELASYNLLSPIDSFLRSATKNNVSAFAVSIFNNDLIISIYYDKKAHISVSNEICLLSLDTEMPLGLKEDTVALVKRIKNIDPLEYYDGR